MSKQLEKRWYAIHTYSGYEDAVARYLKQRVESMAMSDKIFGVVVPKETKIKVKNGKRYNYHCIARDGFSLPQYFYKNIEAKVLASI